MTRGDGPVDLAFAAGPEIRRIISGELAPDRAIATPAEGTKSPRADFESCPAREVSGTSATSTLSVLDVGLAQVVHKVANRAHERFER